MKLITVFTPTYNREKFLEKAYESLLKQTSQNFIWLIVDDGSTDNTEKIVRKWIEDNKICIKYYKKINEGKAQAYNYAIDNTVTEYFLFCLDSDEVLVENAIEFFEKKISSPKDYIGYVSIRHEENALKKYSTVYDVKVMNGMSYAEALKKDLVKIETIMVYKTNYLKKFKFPKIDGEKFFTEAYIFFQMDEVVDWNDKVLVYGKYLDDGLTKNTIKLYNDSPRSWYLYNKLRLEKTEKKLLKLKYIVYMIIFGLMSKTPNIIKNSKYKLLTIIFFPIGFIGMLYLKIKNKKG